MKAIGARLAAAIVAAGLSWPVGTAESTSTPAVPASGTAGCGNPLAAGLAAGRTVTREIASGGSKRIYVLHLSAAYDPAKPAPLVLDFHGFGGSAEQQTRISGFVPISDREGFILVSPDGGGAWRFAESSREANTAFVRDVVADVSAALCVDAKRIFAAGKSQGGFMSSWLGCMAPDLVTAIAPVSGMYEPTAQCQPVPILEFHGQADKLIPFKGGHVLVLGHFEGAVAVMGKWAAMNGCAGEPETVAIDAHVQRVTYRQCRAATIQIITDAGHTWPGTPVREGDNTVPADLPASELIWAFFKAHPKP